MIAYPQDNQNSPQLIDNYFDKFSSEKSKREGSKVVFVLVTQLHLLCDFFIPGVS